MFLITKKKTGAGQTVHGQHCGLLQENGVVGMGVDRWSCLVRPHHPQGSHDGADGQGKVHLGFISGQIFRILRWRRMSFSSP